MVGVVTGAVLHTGNRGSSDREQRQQRVAGVATYFVSELSGASDSRDTLYRRLLDIGTLDVLLDYLNGLLNRFLQ